MSQEDGGAESKRSGQEKPKSMDRRALLTGAAIGAAGATAVALGADAAREAARPYISPPPLKDGEAKIAKTFQDSRPVLHARAMPPNSAPNIVVIILDDVGFADLGCYGGEIKTPHIDSLAQRGLRYANFRTTAMCSPTRAAFLTGLNHHSAGMGWLADIDSGYPGYRGDLTQEAATIAEVLRDKGWSTFLVGKWHVNNGETTSAVGPYDNWPTNRGYERAYWFQGHSTDYFKPSELFDGIAPVEPPTTPDYYVTDDLTDRAIAYIRTQHSLAPDRPFYMHIGFPGAHSPLQARAADRDAYKGAYDGGWDKIRAARLEKQRAMGLVPETTQLPPLSFGADPWDGLTPEQKRLYARYMEVYAGLITSTDRAIGRLLQTLDDLNLRDNTLFMVFSDNGGSAEGTPTGTPNVFAPAFGRPVPLEEAAKLYDVMGEDATFPHYPMGWACASNTPFRLYKQYAHQGGVADPLVISWPDRIRARGQVRQQFVHVVDLFPTLLEAAGVERPEDYRGVKQKALEGASFVKTFAAANADTRTDQYFELGGQRAFQSGKWRLVTRHERGKPFETDRWELYDLTQDINELTDVASANPQVVADLIKKWEDAALKYGIYPLDDRNLVLKLIQARQQRGIRRNWVLKPPIERLSREAAPVVCGLDHNIEIEIMRPRGDEDGVLVAHGSKHAGYVLYVKDGIVHYEQSLAPWAEKISSTVRLPKGRASVRYQQRMTSRPFDGMGALSINARQVAQRTFDRALFSTSYDGFSLGADLGNQVSSSYDGPNPFQGEIVQVKIDIDARPVSPLETTRFLEAMGMRL
jgi:arylsulfatase